MWTSQLCLKIEQWMCADSEWEPIQVVIVVLRNPSSSECVILWAGRSTSFFRVTLLCTVVIEFGYAYLSCTMLSDITYVWTTSLEGRA